MSKESNIEIAKDSLRKERQRIEAQITSLQQDIIAIKRAEDILTGGQSQQVDIIEMLPLSHEKEKEKMTPTKAILELLGDRPEKWWPPVAITKELSKGKLQTTSSNPHNIISATLVRLLREQRIEKKPQAGGKGKYVYRIKQEG